MTAEFAAFAKERGIGITAEATPHHLALCDEALAEWGANAKMNPPLAARSERDWLRKATAQGLIDCIATDHAPHAARLKNQGLAQAPFGIIGLETAFAVVHTVLVDSGLMDLPRLIALMTFRPARILGLSAGTLAPGAAADVAILDPNWSGSIGDSWLHSKSRNTPFLGYRARGRVAASFVGGRLVFREGALAE
ncbi:MAG: Dihydroorotase [candidate division BRC1 bacterium ADurb.BinA364]|nr:MAG: Dihydroorotase [candidate division BRC1 bacterium ADurb.BinA364]